MKTNQDKLNDALGMVDQDLVQETMTHTENLKAANLARRAVIRRRFAMLAAACLAFALMAGAILAVPLLTADEPSQTRPPVTVTTEDGLPFYVETPLVRVSRLSATETAEITAPAISAEPLSTQVTSQDDFFSYYSFLVPDCEPGETVTLTADTDCLLVIDKPYEEVLAQDSMLDYGLELWKCAHRREHPVYYSTQDGPVECTYFENTVTFDPAVSCVYLRLRAGDTDRDEGVISFTLKNAEGQITGAGSVCVTRYYLLSSEMRQNDMFIAKNPHFTRAAVLGSVRFTDPAAVTEEQVAELIADFEAGAEAARADMDFTPVTALEKRFAVYAEILTQVFAEEGHIFGGHCGMYGENDYSFFGTHHQDGRDREFIIFGDGTWAEYLAEQSENCRLSYCHADPNCPNANATEMGTHHPITWGGCHLVTTDGRVYELVKGDWENGILGTTRLIEDRVVEEFAIDPNE